MNLRNLFRRKQERDFPAYWQAYLSAFDQPYRRKTPVEEVRFVVFDTEATGLDLEKDHVLSIGAVAVKGNEIAISDRLECYVHQNYEPSAETIAVHGILPGHPAQGEAEREAIESFINYIGNAVLVAHHAAFDVGMINKILQREIGQKLKNKVLDTSYLARRLAMRPQHARPGTFGLDNLCRLYQIPMSDRHTAGGDAFITAVLLLKLLARLRKRGVNTLGDLLKAKREL